MATFTALVVVTATMMDSITALPAPASVRSCVAITMAEIEGGSRSRAAIPEHSIAIFRFAVSALGTTRLPR
ncbi:MAG: hypothetical protein ACM31C_01055 [Acidobacteriota bacterium]